MHRLLAAVSTAALAVGSAVAVVTLAAPASAAPTACNASQADIYKPPAASAIGAPGTLIACRQISLAPWVTEGGNANAFLVQYSSRNNKDQPIAVSGTVIVPKKAWAGSGTRPLIAFNPGTLGIGSQCAFSKQLGGAYQDAYEAVNVDNAIQDGFAFAATDGVGYLDGQLHPYVIGKNSGQAMLDIARTASQIPNAGVARTTKVGLWGYSEGGQASLWAAQLAKSYAPELNIVGAAAGGVPGDLTVVGKQLNGGPFAGFLADAAVGLSTAYPELPFDSVLNQRGKDAIKLAKTQCLIGTLANFLGARLEDFTNDKLTLDQLRTIAGPDGTTWGQVLDAQTLGVNIGKPGSGAKYEIGFPTFQYRGALEEIISIPAENATRDRFCKAGIVTDWNQFYPGEHLTTDWLAVDDSLKWLSDRFAGKTTSGNCWFPAF